MDFNRTCICNEFVESEINSLDHFNQVKSLISFSLENSFFIQEAVSEPYYIGTGKYQEIKWFANEKYTCKICGTSWLIKYPDFPSVGFIKRA